MPDPESCRLFFVRWRFGLTPRGADAGALISLISRPVPLSCAIVPYVNTHGSCPGGLEGGDVPFFVITVEWSSEPARCADPTRPVSRPWESYAYCATAIGLLILLSAGFQAVKKTRIKRPLYSPFPPFVSLAYSNVSARQPRSSAPDLHSTPVGVGATASRGSAIFFFLAFHFDFGRLVPIDDRVGRDRTVLFGRQPRCLLRLVA